MDEFNIILWSALGKAITVVLAILLFAIIDRVWLRWLNIRDVIERKGYWADRDVMVRVQAVRGWFLLASVIILGFLIGGAI